ncbi:hypothetical protein [Streptomyces stelliscabiei]|uniref:hypothetical protein n=1 Tax=Streptomyces stelliscabiei TaxID=146820 RepID=UPI003EBCB944
MRPRWPAHVVSATCKAYKIPLPVAARLPAWPPEDKARLEQQVAVLLLQGATCAEITAEVGPSAPTIRPIRPDWNIPEGRSAEPPARSPRPSPSTPRPTARPRPLTGPYCGRMPQLFAEGRSH